MRVCNNHDYCRVDMPKKQEKIKYSPGKKSLKVPFIIYVDLECLLKKYNLVKITRKCLYREKSYAQTIWIWMVFNMLV